MKKGTYQIRRNAGELLPVQAWEFDLLGIGPLIVTKDPDLPKAWSVVEPKTGAFFTRNHQTRKGAIQGATDMVHIHRTITRELFDRNVDWILSMNAADPTDYYKELLKQEAQEENDRCINNEAGG